MRHDEIAIILQNPRVDLTAIDNLSYVVQNTGLFIGQGGLVFLQLFQCIYEFIFVVNRPTGAELFKQGRVCVQIF